MRAKEILIGSFSRIICVFVVLRILLYGWKNIIKA